MTLNCIWLLGSHLVYVLLKWVHRYVPNRSVKKLFVLDKNTWYHKTVQKQLHKKCDYEYTMNVIL